MKTQWAIEMEREITPLCHADGVGCDGSHDDGYRECRCTCHSLHAPDFVTNADVIKWHLPAYTWLKISNDAAAQIDPSKFEMIIGYDGSHYVSKRY